MPLYNPGGSATDATVSFSDITTNNSSTSKHGFLAKLDNNSAHFMDGTGAWSAPSASVWDATVTKSADESVTSSTTLQDDDELQFSVLGTKMYRFEAFIAYNEPAASGTPDFDCNFAVSTGSFTFLERANIYQGSTGAATLDSSKESGPTTTSGSAGTMRAVLILGWFVASADCTVKFQWAQHISSTNTVTVKAGSYIRYQKVA